MSRSIEDKARAAYRAYELNDRAMIEALIGEDFSFTSPYDDHIDRQTYFARCWPNADRIDAIDIKTLAVQGDEAFVLYEVTPKAGGRFRNCEFLTFKDGRLAAVEVFFGEITGVEQKP